MASELVLIEQWRERLKRQSESDLTVEAFCKKEGVSTSMFYRWRRHLQDSSAEPAAVEPVDVAQRAGKKRSGPPRRKRAKKDVPSSEPATGHQSQFLRLPVRSVRSMPWTELTLVDGTVVRLPQENLEALSMVLQTLRTEHRDGMTTEARHA